MDLAAAPVIGAGENWIYDIAAMQNPCISLPSVKCGCSYMRLS